MRGDGGNEHFLQFAGGERWGFEERNLFVENGRIAGDFDVVGDDVGEPSHIVGAARADAQAGFGVPPVLDVAFGELAGSSGQD